MWDRDIDGLVGCERRILSACGPCDDDVSEGFSAATARVVSNWWMIVTDDTRMWTMAWMLRAALSSERLVWFAARSKVLIIEATRNDLWPRLVTLWPSRHRLPSQPKRAAKQNQYQDHRHHRHHRHRLFLLHFFPISVHFSAIFPPIFGTWDIRLGRLINRHTYSSCYWYYCYCYWYLLPRFWWGFLRRRPRFRLWLCGIFFRFYGRFSETWRFSSWYFLIYLILFTRG